MRMPLVSWCHRAWHFPALELPCSFVVCFPGAVGAAGSADTVCSLLRGDGPLGVQQLTPSTPPVEALTSSLSNWRPSGRPTWSPSGTGAVSLHVNGTYTEAFASYNITLANDGTTTIAYTFTWRAALMVPRQLGLAFTLPPTFSRLSYRRRAQFSWYPETQIGRRSADYVDAAPGPPPSGGTPSHAWSQDTNELGTKDFRSTRHNITAFRLSATAGDTDAQVTLRASSEQSQHGRAWISGGAVRLLAADVSNEGGNPFSRERVLPCPKLAPGTDYRGAVKLSLGKGPMDP